MIANAFKKRMTALKVGALAGLMAGVSLLTGCAGSLPIASEGVHSIVVLPPANETVYVNADLLLGSLVPKQLAERRGYYIFPFETVRMIFEQEGLYEGERIRQLPPEKVAEMFHADAVLYTTIKRWEATYLLLETDAIIEAEFALYRKDGKLLFKTVRRDDESVGGLLVASPLDAVLSANAAAVGRANPTGLFKQVADEIAYKSFLLWEHNNTH